MSFKKQYSKLLDTIERQITLYKLKLSYKFLEQRCIGIKYNTNYIDNGNLFFCFNFIFYNECSKPEFSEKRGKGGPGPPKVVVENELS